MYSTFTIDAKILDITARIYRHNEASTQYVRVFYPRHTLYMIPKSGDFIIICAFYAYIIGLVDIFILVI